MGWEGVWAQWSVQQLPLGQLQNGSDHEVVASYSDCQTLERYQRE